MTLVKGHNRMAILSLFQYVKETITFPAGHIIYKEGEANTGLAYVVLEGEVEVTFDGKYLETTTAGGLLGELSLLDNKPHSSTCVAKTDVKLAPIDQQRFLFMIQETPFFAIEVMRVMADRLRRERIQA
jgi:CRP/FNR family transcriptional regulator, cyclic AMP receptor protein